MTNGIDWEVRTGKPIDKITMDDKLTVIVSVLDSLREDVKPLPLLLSTTCKVVEKHKTYWIIAGWLGGLFGAGTVTVLIKLLFHL